MTVTPPSALDVLEQIRGVAAQQFIHPPDLLTTDRRGDLEGAWDERDGAVHWVPACGDHLHYRHRAQRLTGLVRVYPDRAGAEPDRIHVPDPRFPRSVVLRITPAAPVHRCPACGATDTEGDDPLDAMLQRWQDPTGSGWQCLNPECYWLGEDDEIE